MSDTPQANRPKSAQAQTFSAYETLPDGRERPLIDAAGLTYDEMLVHKFHGQTWAVSWRQDRKL